MAVFSLISQSLVWAEPSFCEKQEATGAIQMIKIPSKPNYFFRTFPQAHLISYASDKGNFILDMNSGEQFHLPGSYDPVPLGEHVMSVPDSTDGMSFYSVAQIMEGNSKPDLLLRSKSLLGVYQSVGTLARMKGYDIFAVIVAGGVGVNYQKIRVAYEPQLRVEEEGEVLSLCEEVDIKLPMLSKDGREVSGLDAKTGTTKIWKFDFKNRQCIEMDDLGIHAAKADFSYDNDSLVFHLRGDGSKDVEFFEKAESKMNMSVYSYNRRDKQIYKISHARPGDNSYYPVYREDGSLVYAVVDREGVPSFAHAIPSKLNLQTLNLKALSQSPLLHTWLAIGQTWNLRCLNAGHEMKAVELILSAAFAMDRQKCLALLEPEKQESLQSELSRSDIVSSSNKDLNFSVQEMSEVPLHELKRACLQL
jgi:hypothetical protein